MRQNDIGLHKLAQEWLVGKKDLVGIEIGSFAGESAEIFLETGAFKKLYCIDPWIPDFDKNDKTTGNKVRLTNAEKEFDKRFSNNDIVEKVKQLSAEAVNMFEDESIDFIYIDGNHQYEFVKNDLVNYFPKVKRQGIIAGHDYALNITSALEHIKGVRKAVDEFFEVNPMKHYEDNSWIQLKSLNPSCKTEKERFIKLKNVLNGNSVNDFDFQFEQTYLVSNYLKQIDDFLKMFGNN